VYQLTWVGGWTEAGIQGLFTPLLGRADVAFVTFFKTTPAGIDCMDQSPCTTVWSSVWHSQSH
jgi:hypothetical protein